MNVDGLSPAIQKEKSADYRTKFFHGGNFDGGRRPSTARDFGVLAVLEAPLYVLRQLALQLQVFIQETNKIFVEELAGLEGHDTQAEQEPHSLERLHIWVVGCLSHALHVNFVAKLFPLQTITDDALNDRHLLILLEIPSAVPTQILQEKRRELDKKSEFFLCDANLNLWSKYYFSFNCMCF